VEDDSRTPPSRLMEDIEPYDRGRRSGPRWPDSSNPSSGETSGGSRSKHAVSNMGQAASASPLFVEGNAQDLQVAVVAVGPELHLPYRCVIDAWGHVRVAISERIIEEQQEWNSEGPLLGV
jgi:hypothetical protein